MKKNLVYILLVIFFASPCVFADDYAKIVQKNGKYYLVKKGRVILKNYENIIKVDYNAEKMYYVQQNGKWGVFYGDANVLLKPVYDEIKKVSNTSFIVKTNGKYGLFNYVDKKWAIIPHLDLLTFCTNDYYIARKNRKYGLYSIDKEDWLLDLSFDIIAYENNNFYIRKWGYDGILNQFLQVVLPPIYDEIEYDEDRHVYYVSRNNHWGIADLYGKSILNPIYDDIFSLDLNGEFAGYVVKFHSKYGIISEKNKLVAMYQYDKIERLSEYDDEFLKVKKNRKYGVLKSSGKKIAKCKYDQIQLLKNSNHDYDENDVDSYKSINKNYVFIFQHENHWGVLNTDGKEIVFPNYQEIYTYYYGKDVLVFVVKRNNRFGVVEVDKDGIQTFTYKNKPLDEIISEEKLKIKKQNPLFKLL